LNPAALPSRKIGWQQKAVAAQGRVVERAV
jgi:hypothetical protein